MADYKKMYYKLFNRLSDVIELLQKAQEEVEEIFIETDGDLEPDKSKSEGKI